MDKKAKKILFSTYWKNGWIDSKERILSDEDFEYAKSQGLMFEPLSISHDECINAIVHLLAGVSHEQLAKGFLSSLMSRRLDWRSSLSSYAIAKNIPQHNYTPVTSGGSYTGGQLTSVSYTCGVCRDCQYGLVGYENYENSDINVLILNALSGVVFAMGTFCIYTLI